MPRAHRRRPSSKPEYADRGSDLAVGYGGEGSNSEAGRQPSCQLCRSKNCGIGQPLHVVRVGATGRRCADASGIEQSALSEQVRALEKERPALVEENLIRREVDDRGVALDLPEIRVERDIEREVRSRPDLGDDG